MSALGLTPRQRDALAFIGDYINSRGCAPSYEEIAAGLSLSSKSGVNRLVLALESRGHIRRNTWVPRSIEVIHCARQVALEPGVNASLCAAARRHEVSPETLIARAVEVFLRSPQA